MVKLVWYNDLGVLLAHLIDTVIECLYWYYICTKLLFLWINVVVLHEKKENFASNFIIKQNPFGPTNGATRCVSDVPPIENNQDYSPPCPHDCLFRRCDAAGCLQLPF